MTGLAIRTEGVRPLAGTYWFCRRRAWSRDGGIKTNRRDLAR
jgi:hypothetical protein